MLKEMTAGLDKDSLEMTLHALRDYARGTLPPEDLLGYDARDEFPEKIVRAIGGELGIQLLFIPQEYNGMGGDAFDIYRVCEEMARIDLGIATGVLATFL